MVEQKLVINDVKTGKSYQKAITDDSLIGKKLHEKISGDTIGLQGYELEITGGSDIAGFPMRADIEGAVRKRALLSSGVGLAKIKRKGQRLRKTVAGNTVSESIVQINAKIVKYGAKKLEEALGIAPKEEKEAVKEEGETESKEEKPTAEQNKE